MIAAMIDPRLGSQKSWRDAAEEIWIGHTCVGLHFEDWTKGLNAKLSISRIQFSEYLTTNIAWYFLSIFWLDKIKPESQTLFFSITSSPWQVSLLGINLADHNVAATLFSESALACDEPCKSKHVSTLVICEIVGLYFFFVSQHRRQPPWSDKPIL